MLPSPTWRALAWRVLQVTQAHLTLLTSGYPGLAQSCSFVNVLRLIDWPYTHIVMDCNSDGFQCLMGSTAYWLVHAIDYWQGANVKCRRHGMACSVMEAQSHVEGMVEEV